MLFDETGTAAVLFDAIAEGCFGIIPFIPVTLIL
jgi:hypothetical protein